MKIIFVLILGLLIVSAAMAESTSEVATFNGEISISMLKDGKTIQETLLLKPGEALVNKEIMQKISSGKSSITWADVAKFEADLLSKDLFSKLVIDNLWAQRINRVLGMLEAKYGYLPPLDSVLGSLGIPKDRPTGGEYNYIPGPNNNPARGSRLTYRDVNLNEYLDPYNEAADTIAGVEVLDPTEASRSK